MNYILRLVMITVLIMLICLIPSSFSCCGERRPHQAFCNAGWISHLKVLPNPDNSTDSVFDIQGHVTYTVEHKQIFKMPHNWTSLPSILTSHSGTSISVNLETGVEYLLSGNIVDDNAGSSRLDCFDECNQIHTFSREWRHISEEFKKSLAMFKC